MQPTVADFVRQKNLIQKGASLAQLNAFLSKQFDVNKVSHKSKLHEYVRNVMVHFCKECKAYFFISFSLSLPIIKFDHFNYEAPLSIL